MRAAYFGLFQKKNVFQACKVTFIAQKQTVCENILPEHLCFISLEAHMKASSVLSLSLSRFVFAHVPSTTVIHRWKMHALIDEQTCSFIFGFSLKTQVLMYKKTLILVYGNIQHTQKLFYFLPLNNHTFKQFHIMTKRRSKALSNAYNYNHKN